MMSNVMLIRTARLLVVRCEQVFKGIRIRGHWAQNPQQTQQQNKPHGPRTQVQHGEGVCLSPAPLLALCYFPVSESTEKSAEKLDSNLRNVSGEELDEFRMYRNIIMLFSMSSHIENQRTSTFLGRKIIGLEILIENMNGERIKI